MSENVNREQKKTLGNDSTDATKQGPDPRKSNPFANQSIFEGHSCPFTGSE